jgi:uncharacterized membrane protein YcjF (UPF0283 family)
MIKNLKKLLYPIGILISIVFLLVVINQLVSLYKNLDLIHPWLAIAGTTIIGLIILSLIIAPLLLITKLPAPLPFPDDNTDLGQYKIDFKERLVSHPVAKELNLDPHNDEQLRQIHEKLTEKADKIIFETASAVFVSTAISQNGKLDAFTVLAAQIRLIWKVAHIYWQRPSLKNLQQLYSNVAINAMAANTIEQIDISQQIQPIISAILKSPGKHLPVVGNAAHLITESIMEGTVNAFLSLRVGVLTKNYCFPEGKTISELKSNSFLEASVLLKKLVVKSSKKVVEGILKAGKNASVQTFKTGYEAVGKVVSNAKTGISGIFSSSKKIEESEN